MRLITTVTHTVVYYMSSKGECMKTRLLWGIQENHGFGCEEELFWDKIPEEYLNTIDTHTEHQYNAPYNGGIPCGDTYWIYCAEAPEEPSEDWMLNFWQGSGELFGDPDHPLQAGCKHWTKEDKDWYRQA